MDVTDIDCVQFSPLLEIVGFHEDMQVFKFGKEGAFKKGEVFAGFDGETEEEARFFSGFVDNIEGFVEGFGIRRELGEGDWAVLRIIEASCCILIGDGGEEGVEVLGDRNLVGSFLLEHCYVYFDVGETADVFVRWIRGWRRCRRDGCNGGFHHGRHR